MRTSNRRPRALLVVLGAALALMTVVAPVGAATPQQVNIVSHMTFPGNAPNYGTFEATGSAVENGLICERGTVLDTKYVVGGWQSGRAVQILVRKQFTCTDENGIPDGSGTFVVKIQVHAAFDGTETFSWIVQGGTGAYEDLRGAGNGVTVDPTPTGNTNIYDGFLVQ